MTNQLTTSQDALDDKIAAALIQGDLSRLSPAEKRDYYLATCKSLGLNPLTKPFEYLRLNNKEILYATKSCTEQLRNIQRMTLALIGREVIEGVYVVTARATIPGNATMGGMYGDRTDESTGAVAIDGLKGEARANAMMKAETKAKRRVTLSICGLGMLDESEVESIPGAQVMPWQEHSEPSDSAAMARMHFDRIAAAVTLDELRTVGEAVKADANRMAKGDVAYLRASAKEQREKIVARQRSAPSPVEADPLENDAQEPQP